MRKSFLLFFVLCVFLFLISAHSQALDIPPVPTGRVNDYAGMLDASSRTLLEERLKSFEEATSNQIVVAIFPSLEGESLEDFSIRLADRWKIGQKKNDNGVILLIFKNDRKLRIEVGYGLEGVLPDATVSSIIRNEIVPYFKQGDFKSGVFAGVSAIMAATKGEYRGKPSSEGSVFSPILSLLLIFIIFIIVSSMARRFGGGRRGSTFSSGGSWGGWSSGGSSGGGFSGGGGSFGGGGSSGSW